MIEPDGLVVCCVCVNVNNFLRKSWDLLGFPDDLVGSLKDVLRMSWDLLGFLVNLMGSLKDVLRKS